MRIIALLLATGVMLLGACGRDEWPTEAAPSPTSTSPSPSITADPPTGTRVLYDGTWSLAENGWFISTPSGFDRLSGYPHAPDAFRGQSQGLVGARVSGALDLTPPVLWGDIAVRVELLGKRPEVGKEWEDVVEVSFTTPGGRVVMNSFEDFTRDFRLPAGTYRVRYSARGLDRARDAEYDDPYLAGNTLPGRHLFQFWPAEAAPDKILRGESQTAASARKYHTGRR